MVEIVNGYVCLNCTDTERAHKGIDPNHPNGGGPKDLARARAKAEARAAASGEQLDAAGRPIVVGRAGRAGAADPSCVVTGLTGAAAVPVDLPRPSALPPPGTGLTLDLTV